MKQANKMQNQERKKRGYYGAEPTSAELQYEDIIHLPRPISPNHRPMSGYHRAAQFASFDALTGFGDAVDETARLTDTRIILTEDKKQMLDETLHLLMDMIDDPPTARITHFIPDTRKEGGAYVTVAGKVTAVDTYAACVFLSDKRRIPIADILDIEL
jgi:hypothetical protein